MVRLLPIIALAAALGLAGMASACLNVPDVRTPAADDAVGAFEVPSPRAQPHTQRDTPGAGGTSSASTPTPRASGTPATVRRVEAQTPPNAVQEINAEADAGTGQPARLGREEGKHALAGYARTIGVAARVLLVLSILASFAAVFVPIIPRDKAFASTGLALVLVVLQYVVLTYGVLIAEAAFWLSLGALVLVAVAVAYPLFEALRNKQLSRVAARLTEAGDVRAAAAIKVEANPDDFKTRRKRKDLLASMRAARGGFITAEAMKAFGLAALGFFVLLGTWQMVLRPIHKDQMEDVRLARDANIEVVKQLTEAARFNAEAAAMNLRVSETLKIIANAAKQNKGDHQ